MNQPAPHPNQLRLDAIRNVGCVDVVAGKEEVEERLIGAFDAAFGGIVLRLRATVTRKRNAIRREEAKRARIGHNGGPALECEEVL